MAGFLAAAMKGASGEYLKQQDEDRAAKRQEIRDQRLNEYQQDNIRLQSELATEENIRKEGVLAEAAAVERENENTQKELDRIDAQYERETTPLVLSEGQVAVDRQSGEEIARGRDRTFAPNASADAEAARRLYRMGPGGEKGAATNMKEMMDQYKADPAVWTTQTIQDPLTGASVKVDVLKPDAPGMIEYINQNLHEGSRLHTNLMSEIKKDPDRMWDFARGTRQFQQDGGVQAAIDYIRSIHGNEWKPTYGAGAAEGSNEGTVVPEPGSEKVPFVE